MLACGKRKAQVQTMAEHKNLPAREKELKQSQGGRLRHLRVALGLSQTEAATVAGVSLFKWHRMEKGEHPIDPLALQIFCDAHGTGADYVITAKRGTLRDDLQAKIALQEAAAQASAQAIKSAEQSKGTATDNSGPARRKRLTGQAVAAA
jgi:transcriptional regulator with XRE-family HTH domain